MIHVSDHIVTFRKSLWSEEDLALAESIGMSYDTDKAEVSCSIRLVAPLAVIEFAKKVLKVFMESPEYVQHREEALGKLREAYKGLYSGRQEELRGAIPFYDRLYKHQKVGLQECFLRRDNLLAFEMGLGKTVTAASLSLLDSSKLTLVICPNLVKWNWYRDLTEKFGFDPSTFTILDSASRRTIRAFIGEKFIIVNYEAVKKYYKYIIEKKPDHIILDECHKIKNTNTTLFKAAKYVADHSENARITMLSGSETHCSDRQKTGHNLISGKMCWQRLQSY